MRLAEKGRHQRQQQQRDQPRRIEDQARGKARHRHDVLRLAEQLPHQRHPSAGLAARALELVLELGVLEVFEVERCGMLHQADARGIGHAFRKQAVDERDDAAENVGQHRQREFGRAAARARQFSCPLSSHCCSDGRLVRQLHQQHDVIDDQLADIEGRDRQQRPDQPQQPATPAVSCGLVRHTIAMKGRRFLSAPSRSLIDLGFGEAGDGIQGDPVLVVKVSLYGQSRAMLTRQNSLRLVIRSDHYPK